MGRDIVIGDVHGCLEELEQLLERVRYDTSADRLTFVGDLVDRGPDSVGVVRLVRKLAREHAVVCVRGNHEDKYLRYRARLARDKEGAVSFPEPKRILFEAFVDGDLDWFESLPLHAQVGSYLVVHGGIDRRHQTPADLEKKRYRSRLMVVRRVDPDTHQMSEGGIPWAQLYDGRFGPVAYGHEPDDEIRIDTYAVGLDTGCCFGGKLTAMILEEGRERRFLSIDARRAYAPWRIED